jgi:hypothetical protein
VKEGLEEPLGDALHWTLTSSDYRGRDEVWKLRAALAAQLEPQLNCQCLSLRELANVPMGGDGRDERVFATIEPIKGHSEELWWLYLAKCTACGQHWMVAQETRIFDEHFLRRLDPGDTQQILSKGRWPAEFLTYERVLKIGRELSQPCRFLETLAPSLVWTAEDLHKARPSITLDEIAYLIGVTPEHASQLLSV